MKRKQYQTKHRPAAGKESPGAVGRSTAAAGRAASRRLSWLSLVVLLGVAFVVWWSFRPRRQGPSVDTGSAAPRAARQAAATPGQPLPAAAAGPRQPGGDKDKRLVEAVNQANQLLAKGKPEDAAQVLREAEKLNPEDEDVHYNLGIALARLGRNEEAEREYNEALRLFPDYAEAHNNLGNLLLRVGRRDQALSHFEQAVKIMPEYASAWNNYGTAMQQLGRTNEAGSYFEKAAQLDTNYWQAHFDLATSYLQQGRPAEARRTFETVLRLQPDFVPAQRALERLEKEYLWVRCSRERQLSGPEFEVVPGASFQGT